METPERPKWPVKLTPTELDRIVEGEKVHIHIQDGPVLEVQVCDCFECEAEEITRGWKP